MIASQGSYRKILSKFTHFSQTFSETQKLGTMPAIWCRKATGRYATLPHNQERGTTLTVAGGQRALSVKTDRKCILCDSMQQFFKLLFGLGKCSF